ncbi:4-hydroxy-tetrahydrodipicolinate reductase [Massiliimalia timonensis]|uniref:4-hydroxy-tetrahydrodipicolinate reductase n=1 Tax=Massiliimalia timonensis TaxID=1987501 RepID=UPI000B8AB1FF|nr:4-hydroxy-tetrahydrodipicolinate reductase [Massiliimalia timonensis]MBS7175059.1 4-hydroxy-tetrahydrodipicolinate reductase [Clostridiales bacterium]
MTKIILSGANGKMGKVIARCTEERKDCEIVAGVDLNTQAYSDFDIYPSFSECGESGDVIVDFSNPAVLDGMLDYALKTNTPVVIATTGYSPEQIEKIQKAAEQIPVFFSFNMSLGVNLLVSLAKKAAEVLGGQFDIEIIEKHHNQKIDAPSGTALMIADAINDTLDQTQKYMYDRHAQRKKRDKNEIGIHSVRGGTIVGEHEVIFAGHDELLSLKHQAMSKEIFAVGAVNAAVFLKGKPAGIYDMGKMV